jgi:hypothetical protein
MQHKPSPSNIQLVYYVVFILFAVVAIPHYAVELLEKLHIDVPDRLPFTGTNILFVNVTATAVFILLRIATRAPFAASFWPYAAAADAALHIHNMAVAHAWRKPASLDTTLADIANLFGIILLVITLLDQRDQRRSTETP